MREALDRPAASSEVHHLIEACLFAKNELGVARDATREVGGLPEKLVEERDVEAVAATHHGSEGLGGSAEQIHVGVEAGLVEATTADMEGHTGRGIASARGTHHLCPQQPRRAELGDLHEEVATRRQPELEPGSRGVDVEAAGFHGSKGLHGRGEGEGQLLYGVATSLVIREATGGQGSRGRELGDGITRQTGELVPGLVETHG